MCFIRLLSKGVTSRDCIAFVVSRKMLIIMKEGTANAAQNESRKAVSFVSHPWIQTTANAPIARSGSNPWNRGAVVSNASVLPLLIAE